MGSSALSGAEPTASPIEGKIDWYRLRDDLLSRVIGVPGVTLWRDEWVVHRSVLPILFGAAPVADVSANRQYAGFVPRAHQLSAANFIRSRYGTLLADQMRLGKTLSTLLAHDPSSGPLVVVGPLAVRSVWLTWMNRVFPGEPTLFLTGRKYDNSMTRQANLVFVHYDILAAWAGLGGRRIGTLVFDEAHMLSNYKSQRTRDAVAISPKAEKVVALTGTPLWNKPKGLYNILTMLSRGGAGWGRYDQFANRYPADSTGGFMTRHLEEYKIRMTDVMLRRTWADVQDDLPTVTRSSELVDLTQPQLRALDIEAEGLRDALRGTNVDMSNVAAILARYRRLIGKTKVTATVELAERYLTAGQSVVVWTWHKDIANEIAAQLSRSFLITGDTPVHTREAIRIVWEHHEPSALVMTMAVGQAGIDLSAAPHAIFAELDFTPAVIAQAEMRTFSSSRPMTVDYVVVDHWVEKKLVDTLNEKLRTADLIGVPAADGAIDEVSAQLGRRLVAEVDMTELMRAILEEEE